MTSLDDADPPGIDIEDSDSQAAAEVFDETNSSPDGQRIAHPDQDPGVYDATRAGDDSAVDLSAADTDAFDPDTATDDEIEAMQAADERSGEPRSFAPDREDADHVSDEADSPADYEAESLSDDDIEALGYDDTGP